MSHLLRLSALIEVPTGLNKGLDEATAKGWTVVSMKDDWKTIFPPAK